MKNKTLYWFIADAIGSEILVDEKARFITSIDWHSFSNNQLDDIAKFFGGKVKFLDVNDEEFHNHDEYDGNSHELVLQDDVECLKRLRPLVLAAIAKPKKIK